MPEISIIMPVYNAQQTLEKTAGSILGQSMGDFELIIVDDGSCDGSPQLAAALAARDARVQMLRQPNSGVCVARNNGLAHAKGGYIGFCDDDDELLPGALEALYSLAKKTNADIARIDYRLLRQSEDGTFAELPHSSGAAMACKLRERGQYAAFLRSSGTQFVWNALYKSTLARALRFDPACCYGLEDFVFNAQASALAKTAAYAPFAGYLHYETASSTSACKSADIVAQRIEALPLWISAEYDAALRCCDKSELSGVWCGRQAEFITFLLHQLRDCHAPAALQKNAWRLLRGELAKYPPLDIYALKGQNVKRKAALLLYALHLQRLYSLLPNREVK